MTDRGGSWFKLRTLSSLLIVLVWGTCTLAQQQQYDSLPFTEPSRNERQLARNFARSGSGGAEAQAALQKVVEMEMRKLTSPDELNRYETIRTNLLNEYLATYRPEAQQARKIVIEQIAAFGKGISLGANFIPQSRISALALLAELDDLPAIRSDPPSPSVSALGTLVKISSDQETPIYLRSIALYGLERHIGRFFADWTPDQRKFIGGMLVGIVNSQPESELDLAAHGWMVRRAFDCLAATGDAAVADIAIERLSDAEELPSIRLAAANYMSQIDSRALSAEQKKKYLIGIAHFARSQFVLWYEHEDDLLKRASRSGGYGGGGMYGGYGGGDMYGGGPGGMMGDPGGGDDDMYGAMYGGGRGGRGGRRDRDSDTVKPIETQTWQTLLARRKINQLAQAIRLCLDGRPADDASPPRKIGAPLSVAEMPEELQSLVTELTDKLSALQEAVNNANRITDVESLLQQAETPIVDIMDLVFEIPEFSEQYPDLEEGEELEHVSDQPLPPPGETGIPAGANEQGVPAAGQPGNTQPGGNAQPGRNGQRGANGQRGGNGQLGANGNNGVANPNGR